MTAKKLTWGRPPKPLSAPSWPGERDPKVLARHRRIKASAEEITKALTGIRGNLPLV